MTCADYGVNPAISQRGASFRKCDDEIECRVISNDASHQSLVWLLMARNIFHQQLSDLPAVYITRLVFNEFHRTVLLLRNGEVLGAITFRPFPESEFAEIAFCAITTQQQIQGLGSYLMAHLKTYLQATGILHILTYADNSAIGYFKHQGFTRKIFLNPTVWRRCIKFYHSATLVYCKVLPEIDYLRINDVVAEQKRFVESLLPEYEIEVVTEWPAKEVRGIVIDKGPKIDLKDQMMYTVEKLKGHSRAWPFLAPVSAQAVPHYRETVSEPMDLSTLEHNVKAGKYRSLEHFLRATRLIFSNCYKFNVDDSVYSKSARELEAFFNREVESWRGTLPP
jgi:histone acetyltransferase